jgi:hypothetical protein
MRGGSDQWVPFRVSWGEAHGADARRLVAMLCRRGNIRGSDIGAIRVSRSSSIVEVAKAVAKGFEDAARAPDPRDPRVLIAPMSDGPGPAEPEGDFEPPSERPERPAPQRPRDDVPPSQHRPQRAPALHPPGARAARDFNAKPPRDFAGKAPRDFAAKPGRDFAGKAPRDFAGKAPRDFAAKAPRDFAGSKPAAKPVRDEAPKRPNRKIVVSAPPPRRPKNNKSK